MEITSINLFTYLCPLSRTGKAHGENNNTRRCKPPAQVGAVGTGHIPAARHGRKLLAYRLLLVLEPAAAVPEPSAAAQVRPVSILLEEFLVLRDQVAVDRLPNQALRDEERVQLLLVERTQVDGVLLVAVALYRQRGRPAADPGDGDAFVARRAERRSKEALHLRQAIELSAGAGDDVGRHLLRVRSGED